MASMKLALRFAFPILYFCYGIMYLQLICTDNQNFSGRGGTAMKFNLGNCPLHLLGLISVILHTKEQNKMDVELVFLVRGE